jgi:hypothetical protein
MKIGRGATTWAAVGALIALTVGWPVAGAVGAIGWVRNSDAKGPDQIAAEGIVAAHKGWIYWALGDEQQAGGRMIGRDCLSMLGSADFATNPSATAKQAAELSGVLEDQRYHRDRDLAERISTEALIDLPRPVLGNPLLGALTECIKGSLLSAVCDRWASQRIGNALRSHRAELIAGFKENADLAERLGCRALKGAGEFKSARS